MPQTAAIYGFEFTRPFTAAGLSFHPVENTTLKAHGYARDLEWHHLTGTVTADALTAKTIFDLHGVLSFIEHLNVAVSNPSDKPDAAMYPERYFDWALGPKRFGGGGAVIVPDMFDPTARASFIDLAMTHLADDVGSKQSGMRPLLFKCAETVRQRQPFVEITYFLLISGLEAFCRARENDFNSRNSAEPMTRALRSLGFDVEQDVPSKPKHSMANYLHLRNAVFHEGKASRTLDVNGETVTLELGKYLFHLTMLVSLTIMKSVGFDDGRTNWNCWIDRQLLK